MKYFQEFEEKLVYGSITYKELEIIRANKIRFCQISTAVRDHLSRSNLKRYKKTLNEAMEERTEEVDFIKCQRKKVSILKANLYELPEGIHG